ncbi:MAG: sigma-70 family RNA polymerase sigma factor [Clostridiales bacterium]|jgi:RNA polymerase sigma factor (sigma-70 family)|nr:sigma-70 family RNA polymerase sigma factor [Clostridiales bacterium]
MENEKTYTIANIFGEVEVGKELYFEYMREKWREDKRLERQTRCRADHGNRCLKDCGECKHDRTGTPVSIDVLAEAGRHTAAHGADPADAVEKLFEYEALYAAIDKLPPRDSSIVRMLKLQGMTERAVAEKVGLTQKGVNYVYHKSLARLREIMSEWR